MNLILLVMNKYNQTGTIKVRPFRTSYSRLTPVETQKDGVLSRSCVYQEFDSAVELSKYRSSDFSLSNLIAIGSFGGLSYVSMSLNSDLDFVDQFAQSFSENVTTTEK